MVTLTINGCSTFWYSGMSSLIEELHTQICKSRSPIICWLAEWRGDPTSLLEELPFFAEVFMFPGTLTIKMAIECTSCLFQRQIKWGKLALVWRWYLRRCINAAYRAHQVHNQHCDKRNSKENIPEIVIQISGSSVSLRYYYALPQIEF